MAGPTGYVQDINGAFGGGIQAPRTGSTAAGTYSPTASSGGPNQFNPAAAGVQGTMMGLATQNAMGRDTYMLKDYMAAQLRRAAGNYGQYMNT